MCLLESYPDIENETDPGDSGQPLFLTPLIKQGKIREAQQAAEVKSNGFKNIKSYSGYLTVNQQLNTNLFFWFFLSQTNFAEDPVLLWLQGGPGATSLLGLFGENGPYIIKSKLGLKLRHHSWIRNHSVIYVDNPAGAGYSFTNPGTFAQNETIIGEQLYEALLQFFQLFPGLQKNDFYATGESYAGKYIPALSYAIYRHNPAAKLKINLQGLAIGNGFCDPENQLKWSDYLFQIGLIDANARNQLHTLEENAVNHIRKKEWKQATDIFDRFWSDGSRSPRGWFQNVTGFRSHFNYLQIFDTSSEHISGYMQRTDVRAAVHVGNLTFHDGDDVFENLYLDVMQSVAPWISELLSHYRILFYNGQLDVIVAYPLTINFLSALKFDAAADYKTAKRHFWYVGEELAGYVKEAGNLTEVVVRNAGHMVPRDQAFWSLDLITKFTRNKPLY